MAAAEQDAAFLWRAYEALQRPVSNSYGAIRIFRSTRCVVSRRSLEDR
jgi:hypothetical protein